MIRQPTSHDAAFAWYREALVILTGRNIRTAVLDRRELGNAIMDGDHQVFGMTEEPECGFFAYRRSRNHIWQGARIWIESKTDDETGELIADEVIRCEINGDACDADIAWPYLCVNPIKKEEFDFLIADREWAKRYAPNDPAANPDRKIDFMTAKPPTFAKGSHERRNRKSRARSINQ